ncbi:hypothetical protein CR513_39048, partial [Mucuna pruriens]
MVYLKAQPYKHPKILWTFYCRGKSEKVAYKLKLLDHARIHPVFHVSQLKKAIVATIPQFLTVGESQVQPKEVLEVRRLVNGESQVLIKWDNLPYHENTWEDSVVINKVFPEFHLEDK